MTSIEEKRTFPSLSGLYPDWNDRDPKNGLENAKEAMDLAERWLGIPQLIQPHEMINPKVDEQSMMTYLSQYPSAKLKPGAPIRPKTNSARVRCYGKGLFVILVSQFFRDSERGGGAGRGNMQEQFQLMPTRGALSFSRFLAR